MTYNFLITTKKRNTRYADQVSILMYVFAIVIFGLYQRSAAASDWLYPIVIVSILIALVLTIVKKKKSGEAYFRSGLLIAAMGWFFGQHPNGWMGALFVLAAVVEKQVKFPEEIGFDHTGVTFNSFPRKKILWSDISNAMIKDGLITIDQKNNQLFQKEIEGDIPVETEQEFNAFCKHYISK